jgi:hypothetical protein
VQTNGVICWQDKDVVDGIAGALTEVDQIMTNQDDLTEIRRTLKQVVRETGCQSHNNHN